VRVRVRACLRACACQWEQWCRRIERRADTADTDAWPRISLKLSTDSRAISVHVCDFSPAHPTLTCTHAANVRCICAAYVLQKYSAHVCCTSRRDSPWSSLTRVFSILSLHLCNPLPPPPPSPPSSLLPPPSSSAATSGNAAAGERGLGSGCSSQ
jgi:hypothetical protein